MSAATQAKEQAAWMRRYYGQLRGWKVSSVSVKVEDDFGWPQCWPKLTMTHPDHPGVKLEIEVSQDEEGNGPGFLFGLPLPEPMKGGR